MQTNFDKIQSFLEHIGENEWPFALNNFWLNFAVVVMVA